MKKESLLRENRKTKIKIIEMVLLIISVLIIGISILWVRPISDTWNAILISVGASILSTLIVTCITKIFNGFDISDEIIERFDVLKVYQEQKLIGIYNHFPFEEDRFRNDFINSDLTVIVMNDAKSFISRNQSLLNERITEKGKETIFIIEDYLQEDIISALERKNGHEMGYYKSKIYDVIGYEIVDLFRKGGSCGHIVKLYLNHNINTLGIVLTDNNAYESIYRVSAGKTTVPHFVFNAGGMEYEEAKNDVNKLLLSNEKGAREVDLAKFAIKYHDRID